MGYLRVTLVNTWEITVIDKIDFSDPTSREFFLMHELKIKTLATLWLIICDTYLRGLCFAFVFTEAV